VSEPVLWIDVVLDGVRRRRLALGGAPVTVGRGEENDLVLADDAVSREHCRLSLAADRVRLDDLGSANGTFRGGQRIDRATLEVGDEVEIGPFVLRVGTGDGAALVLEETRETLQGVPEAPRGEAAATELEVVLNLLASFDLRAGGDAARTGLLDALLQGLGAERAVLWRYRSKRGKVEEVLRHAPDEETRALPVSSTLALDVARSREPCLVRGKPGTPGPAPAGAEAASVVRLAEAEVRSVMAVPMERGRKLVGVLYLDSRSERRPFQRRDLELLARAAAALAGLVDGLTERDRLAQENLELRRAAGSGRRVLPLEQLASPDGAMRHGPGHRGDRHRQGGAGPLDPRPLAAARGLAGGGELRGDPRGPAGVRALRPRQGSVLRGREGPRRAHRASRRGHPLPRRGR
jgi:hypothetical protein